MISAVNEKENLPKEYYKLLRDFECTLWITQEDPWDVDDFTDISGGYDRTRLFCWLKSCPAYLDWAYEEQTNIPRFDFFELARDLQKILTYHRIYRDYKKKEIWMRQHYSQLEESVQHSQS